MQLTIPVTSAQLTILLKEKSKHAFSVLYDNYNRALFTAIFNIVKDEIAAEDILQDTFVKIWRKIHLYDDTKGALYTWMLNIARNTCFDYLRSKQQLQRNNHSSNGYEECEMIESSFNSYYRIGKAELRLFVKQLEWRYSEVIELVYLNQYTQEETAEMLGIPLGTVKSRARSALRQLREIYNGM